MNLLMFRTACLSRSRFSTGAMRTWPSPYSPKPRPGATATLASASSSFENSTMMAERAHEGAFVVPAVVRISIYRESFKF